MCRTARPPVGRCGPIYVVARRAPLLSRLSTASDTPSRGNRVAVCSTFSAVLRGQRPTKSTTAR